MGERNKSKRVVRSSLCAAAVVAGALAAVSTVRAADVVWTGADSGDWSDTDNWSTGALPTDSATADRAVFDANSTVTTSGFTTVTVTSQSLLGLLIDSGSVSYVIGDTPGQGALTVGRSNASATAISVAAGVTAGQTLNSDLFLINVGSGGTVFVSNNGSGGLTIAGSILKNTASGGNALVFTGTGDTVMSGKIGANPTFTNGYNVYKDGSGTLTLTNDTSTWTGPTRLLNGTLRFDSIANAGSASSLGSIASGSNNDGSRFLLVGGTLEFIGNDLGSGTNNRLFTLAGANVTIAASGAAPLQFTNAAAIPTGLLSQNTVGSTASGSTTIDVQDASRLGVGMAVTGSRVVANTTITAISGNTITLSQATSGGSMSSGSSLSFFGGPRSLTLSGASTADNSLASILEDPTVSNGAVANLTRTSVVKTGAGRWSITGANTYSGGTTVAGGTLLVNNTAGSGTGSGAVGVGSAGTIGGTGSIAGALTVNGTLAPGNSAGRLTVTNNVTLGSTAIFAAEVNGAVAGDDYDQLTVDGDFTVQLGGTLQVSMGTFAASEGQLIYLIDNAGPGATTGTFAGLEEGASIASLAGINGFDWHITYSAVYGNPEGNTNDVALYSVNPVPEPGSLGLLALGGVALLRRRRRNAC